MVSFDHMTLEDGIPIYLQIVRHVKQGIAAGIIRDQEELPSRRVLSVLLGVNPNTVQKAFRLLEEEGLAVSHSGAKSYVGAPPGTAERIRRELLSEQLRRTVQAMRRLGVAPEEASALLLRMWKETEGEE